MCVGQPMGSLQAVKESLLRMRSHCDRLSVASFTSVTANASSSVRSVPTESRQHDDIASMMCIANELIRYMSDDEDLRSLVVNDNKTTLSAGEAETSSDPCVMSIALHHQQLRAQVLTHN